jgi:hypothetical protein
MMLNPLYVLTVLGLTFITIIVRSVSAAPAPQPLGTPVSGGPMLPSDELRHYVIYLQEGVRDTAQVGTAVAQQHGAMVRVVLPDAPPGLIVVMPPERRAAVSADPRVEAVLLVSPDLYEVAVRRDLRGDAERVREVADQLAQQYGIDVRVVFPSSFVAVIPPDRVAVLRADPRIAEINPAIITRFDETIHSRVRLLSVGRGVAEATQESSQFEHQCGIPVLSVLHYLRTVGVCTSPERPSVTLVYYRVPDVSENVEGRFEDHGAVTQCPPRPNRVLDAVPDQYIVSLHDNAGDPEQVANDFAQRYHIVIRGVLVHLRAFGAIIPQHSLPAVEADPRAMIVSPNYLVSGPEPPSSIPAPCEEPSGADAPSN